MREREKETYSSIGGWIDRWYGNCIKWHKKQGSSKDCEELSWQRALRQPHDKSVDCLENKQRHRKEKYYKGTKIYVDREMGGTKEIHKCKWSKRERGITEGDRNKEKLTLKWDRKRYKRI